MADYSPLIPGYNRQRSLYTFADAIGDVLEAFSVDATGKHGRDARRAVIEAYRDLPYRHRWTYFQRVGEVTTAASQDDGTVAYDHTGGTYERMVTLTGGTFPSNARFYRLLIDRRYYDIEDYKSSTVVTLKIDNNPGEDLASGTAYILCRSCYPVPVDFRKGSQLFDVPNLNWPCYVNPEVLLNDQRIMWEPRDFPNDYTVRGGGENYSGLVFEFGPPPSTARTYRYVYESEPYPLRTFGNAAEYKEGTVAVSSTTVTGTGTSWTSDMAGCIIRFPQVGSSSYPSGIVGTSGSDEPYAEQRTIMSVESTTSLTIDTATTGTYSGVKYTIGSPVDLETGAMYSAFQRQAEWVFARLQKERKDIDDRYGRFILALKAAMGADNRNRELTIIETFFPVTLADINRR